MFGAVVGFRVRPHRHGRQCRLDPQGPDDYEAETGNEGSREQCPPSQPDLVARQSKKFGVLGYSGRITVGEPFKLIKFTLARRADGNGIKPRNAPLLGPEQARSRTSSD